MTCTVRPARMEDAAAISRIYNQGIEERVATFETEPRSVEAIEALLAERGTHYPTMVVERDGQVLAWAAAGPSSVVKMTLRLPWRASNAGRNCS